MNNLNKNITKKIKNDPLFIIDESLDKFDTALIKQGETKVFIGIGLSTPNELSEGLPFDVLGMILPAEKLRRDLNLSGVVIQIADSHAISNNPSKKEEVENLADETVRILSKVTSNLGLDSFIIKKASELEPKNVSNLFKSKLCSHPKNKNEYISKEVSDIEFFRQRFNCGIKFSWIIPGVENKGNDERLFDDIFTDIAGHKVNFLHLKPGQSFDKHRWRVPPYIHFKDQNRILLKQDEELFKKFSMAENLWGDKALGGARNHLKRIVRCFESLFGDIEAQSLEEKIIHIIERILQ
jgi:hypothetical protein